MAMEFGIVRWESSELWGSENKVLQGIQMMNVGMEEQLCDVQQCFYCWTIDVKWISVRADGCRRLLLVAVIVWIPWTGCRR